MPFSLLFPLQDTNRATISSLGASFVTGATVDECASYCGSEPSMYVLLIAEVLRLMQLCRATPLVDNVGFVDVQMRRLLVQSGE